MPDQKSSTISTRTSLLESNKLNETFTSHLTNDNFDFEANLYTNNSQKMMLDLIEDSAWEFPREK